MKTTALQKHREIISCELSDGCIVQFKKHTRLFMVQYTGLDTNWQSKNATAETIEPGDWIGLDDSLVKVLRVAKIKI